ncbi:class I SAM-dependent methyltransferase [Geminicoccaceae bacterium 1502E]|nr:class I SAM-dependent methyltransferase [Geminicoccaceae bacterium 1502E]
MAAGVDISGYKYESAAQSHAHQFLMPKVCELLDRLELPREDRRVFDLGCGNGSVAAELAGRGFAVIGVDPSEEGIRQAKASFPDLRLETGSAYEPLAEKYGRFPVVLSLEVVEHVYAPRTYAKTLYDLVEPGGQAIISTPYHGYWKNLALAVTGRMDRHFTALWDHGHIKFWSFRTLRALLEEAGFSGIEFHRVGRVPALARSMFAVAKKN